MIHKPHTHEGIEGVQGNEGNEVTLQHTGKSVLQG